MRQWRARNREHLREYNVRWKAENPERRRQLNRESEQRARERARRRDAKRERDRAYYVAHAEQKREYSRAWRAAREAEDPEGFRAARSAQRKEWWANRPEAVRERAAKAARDRESPPASRERGRAYYARNADRINAERRAYLKEHPEKRREYMNRWRAKERKRIAAGLPKPTRRRTSKAERDANQAAADAFFRRTYTAEQIQRMRQGPPTPPELLYAFTRDSKRARAAHAFAEDAALREQLGPRPPTPAEQRRARQEERRAEEERLDAIARVINERLRRTDPPRRHHNDPAAPHPMLQHRNGTGLHR